MAGRRKRGGKRGSGSDIRTTDAHLHVPFITRNIPPYDLLDNKSLTRIEAAAERIMAEIGFEFRDDPEIVDLFRQAGAKVEDIRENTWRLRFSPGMIREIMATAPARFTQHARNPANNVEIGGDATVLAPSYGSPFVMDLDQGRRYGTIADFENFVKLAQSSPWLHHSGGTICEPTDIAVRLAHIRHAGTGFGVFGHGASCAALESAAQMCGQFHLLETARRTSDAAKHDVVDERHSVGR